MFQIQNINTLFIRVLEEISEYTGLILSQLFDKQNNNFLRSIVSVKSVRAGPAIIVDKERLVVISV